MDVFAKIVYRLKTITILTRSSILRSNTGCWICLGYFFRFTFNNRPFYFLTFLKTSWTWTLHTNVCSRYILEPLYWCGTCLNLTTGIPQQCLSRRFEVLVNFGEVFTLLLGTFIVDLEYSLLILNVIKCYLIVHLYGTPNSLQLCQRLPL